MATLSEDMRHRLLWAGLSVIVGLAQDGSNDRAFARLEAAAKSFGVPSYLFDELAARFDFHYYRPMDCYLSRQGLAEARAADELTLH